ncbi:MAG TPA: ABC transporter permease subunit [Pyrinomonadaceae bacterium]|jgi:ABC-2 type transport system permease protein|nr:ABC transporter permease subunit [Pyrinomonadaceae bacterium]
MAVYEHLYRAYEGEGQTAWSRFLVIPRYALREVFKSKLLTTVYVACFIYPLIAAILVYLHHNANAIALLQINVMELVPIDNTFFRTFLEVQGAFAFILTVLVAPPLISRDLSNNALPLYLCRPLSRWQYVLGKMAVVAFLLSLVTWVPGLLIFIFQASLSSLGWLWSNLWMVSAIFFGSMAWIILLSLIALAISALVKWRVVASGAMLGLFFIPSAFGEIVNNLFLTKSGHLVSLWASMNNIWQGLFWLFERRAGSIRGTISNPVYDRQYVDITLYEPSLWASWLVILLVCAFCIWLLSRKVRAYEVIK